MAKGKYQEWLTEDGLLKIEGWARNGLTNEQIAKNIGINQDTLYSWIKSYPEISESLKKGRKPLEVEIENALVKKAKGFVQEEIIEEITVDPDGNQTKHKKVTHKVFPPDTTAAIFYLKNRVRARYQDRPKTPEEIEAIRLDNKLKQFKIDQLELLLSDKNPTVEKLQEFIDALREDAYAEESVNQ